MGQKINRYKNNILSMEGIKSILCCTQLHVAVCYHIHSKLPRHFEALYNNAWEKEFRCFMIFSLHTIMGYCIRIMIISGYNGVYDSITWRCVLITSSGQKLWLFRLKYPNKHHH